MRGAQARGILALFMAASIWGFAFVAQSVGMDYVGPFTFGFARCMIGSAALLPVALVIDRGEKRQRRDHPLGPEALRKNRRTLLLGGICCGAIVCGGITLQQFGLMYTTVGKAGFITACYILFVPLIGLFLGRRPERRLWFAVALAVVGLYLLCINESLILNRGDGLMLISSVLFALHILAIDYFSPKVSGIQLSCVQFLACGILSGILMLIFETPTLQQLRAGMVPILYSGILSCAVGYTLQIVGQKNVNPTIAALICSTESCISVLAGWLLLGERLRGRELLGCAVMFTAIILSQLPVRRPVPAAEEAQGTEQPH